MKCARHTDVDAIGSCQECQRGLCDECTNRYRKPLCDQCLLEHISKESRQFYIGLGITLIAFLVGYYIWVKLFTGGVFESIIPGLLLAGCYWGWLFLDGRLPELADKERPAWQSLLLKAGYYVVKFIVAICVGIFVGAYRVYTMLKGLATAKALRQELARR